MPLLFGAGVFFVFVTLLEGLVNQLLIGSTPAGKVITGNIWLYALYGGLAAGIFEETGRLIAMKFFMKDDLTPAGSLMYGIGHGGTEAILLGCFGSISNLSTSVSINTIGLDSILSGIPEAIRDATYLQLSPLWTTAPSTFFLGGYERVLAILVHLCCSYIVYRSIADHKATIFFTAILVHSFIDFSIVVINSYAGPFVAEAYLTIIVAVLIFLTVKAYRSHQVPAAVKNQ